MLVSAAWHSNEAPAGVLAFATEPPLELILIEQACGCSSVQGGGKILLVPLVSTAWQSNETPAGVLAFATEPPSKLH